MKRCFRNEKLPFRREEFEIVYHYYLDESTKQEFTDDELDQINTKQVLNKYREKYHLPFPDEIRAIREQYGLTASKMSEALGFGINTYRNYELGEVPSESNARLIQISKNPDDFLTLAKLSNAFSQKECQRLVDRINELNTRASETTRDRFMESYVLSNQRPTSTTGYQLPTLEKAMNMVLFFAQRISPFKTKLNKLMFYADFAHYRSNLVSISGLEYHAIRMGPVPNNFNTLFDFAVTKSLIDINYIVFDSNNGVVGEKFVPTKGANFNDKIFSAAELKTLNEVADRFANVTVTEIINLSHQEAAWLEQEGGTRPINYSYSFNLKHI